MKPLANASPAPSTFRTSTGNGATSDGASRGLNTVAPAAPRLSTSAVMPDLSSAAAPRRTSPSPDAAAISSSVPIAREASCSNRCIWSANVAAPVH